MRRTIAGQCLVAAAIAIATACSPGPSAPSPAASKQASTSTSDGATFSPFPDGDVGCTSIATAGFTTNPDPGDPCENGRFTGGTVQIGDVKVTSGFTLHCDELLSNNFEVNWPQANNFHTDKNQEATCSLVSDPTPPRAPVSRIEIVNGAGTFNGQPGTITLVLVDYGEKAGAPKDRAYIEVNGVAITPGTFADPAEIDGGNIQAHFDQPHKN